METYLTIEKFGNGYTVELNKYSAPEKLRAREVALAAEEATARALGMLKRAELEE